MESFITKKIRRRSVAPLLRLQRRLEQLTASRVPESRVIEKALEFSQAHEAEFASLFEKKRYRLSDLAGIAPGASVPEEEQDRVIYDL